MKNYKDRYAQGIKTAALKEQRLVSIGRYMMAFCLLSFVFCPVMAQSDTALNRSVTVERDFQPVIKAAGKVSTRPEVLETKVEPIEVTYSDYTVEVQPDVTVQPLLSQPTRFVAREPYNGYIRGGIGHPNSLFDFSYHLDDGKQSILDVYAHHRGQWGLRTLSNTKIGLDFMHPFSACTVYFGVNGGNIYYTKYGHFYDYSQTSPSAWDRTRTLYPGPVTMGPKDLTSLWSMEAFIGVKANAKADVQYRVQTGYQLFAKPNAVSEHQIRTHASFDWHRDAHHVGAKLYVQNNFLDLRGNLAAEIPANFYTSRHNIRLEPYYAYKGSRVQLHLGVNIDMNVGRGKWLTTIDNLAFAPSPHVHLEAQIAKKWLTLYADATGSLGTGTVQSFMESNRYRLIHAAIISSHPAAHTPVDAEVGFHIRPHRDLLIELHGGYALYLNTTTLIASTDSIRYQPKTLNIGMQAGDLSYTYCDYSRAKIGGQVNYHYRDVVRVNLYGDYYFWYALRYESNGYQYKNPCAELTSMLNDSSRTVYDRAKWQIGLRVDGKIDKHWSIYSDNRFAGSRLALAIDGEHMLKPTIEMDLGVEYNMWVGKAARSQSTGESSATLPLKPAPKPNLTLFAQVNNILHYKNDIYYGYTTPGINCLMGVTFRF